MNKCSFSQTRHASGSNPSLTLVYRYLESAVKMMGRDKEGVDGAMSGFMSMLEDDKDNVPALLGMSLAFTLESSPNKVRSTLR